MLSLSLGQRSAVAASGIALMLLAAAPASGQDVAQPARVDDTFRIGPGDLLQVFVWREPELTREVRVRSDGKITLPLLGDSTAAGRAAQDLATELSAGLSRFLTEPRVSVGVVSAAAHRFFVVGRVGKPGEFPLVSPTTVLQGLAMAGGLSEYARADGILIVRQGSSKSGPAEPLSFNFKRLTDSRDLRENVLLQAGDTIVVP